MREITDLELEPVAAPSTEPASTEPDTKAIIDGYWVCNCLEGGARRVCKAESEQEAIEYFAAVVRCKPSDVTCDPATSLPAGGCGCGLSRECFELNKSRIVIEGPFDKLL